MIPQAPSSQTARAKASKSSPAPSLQAFTTRSAELSLALKALSKDMQGSFSKLTSMVEGLDTVREGQEDLAQLKRQLKQQLGRLNVGMSLLGTMLETNSSEILKYVKKRK